MNNLHKFCAILAVFAIILESNSFFIESKLDGLVLTVSQQKVPPTGPYQRLGVVLREAQNNTAQQQWNFNELSVPNEGNIWGYGQNAVSLGLFDDNAFSYTYYYNIANNTRDGYRLLIIIPLFPDGAELCVKNPGQGGFHREVKCNINDDSQLWRFV